MASQLNIESFESVFKKHYHYLILISFQIVQDKDVAKDVVQEFFIDFWENRSRSQVLNFKAYATRAIKNLSISHLRKEEKTSISKNEYKQDIEDNIELDIYTLKEKFSKQENTETEINKTLNLLPKKRKEIFVSYVVEGLSYEEIAFKYGISINTVKTQMQRSYKFIRSQVNENSINFIFIAIIFSNFLKNT